MLILHSMIILLIITQVQGTHADARAQHTTRVKGRPSVFRFATRLYAHPHELPALTALAQHISHSHSGIDEKRPTVKFLCVFCSARLGRGRFVAAHLSQRGTGRRPRPGLSPPFSRYRAEGRSHETHHQRVGRHASACT